MKYSHQKIMNSLCVTEKCALGSSNMLSGVFNMDGMLSDVQSRWFGICLKGVFNDQGVYPNQLNYRVFHPHYHCSRPDFWFDTLSCLSHEQDHIRLGPTLELKETYRWCNEVGALLANEDAIWLKIRDG